MESEHTRQRLVRAALELFTQDGYEAATTGRIARKAGVAEGSIYRHFTGKAQLLNEIYRAAARWAVTRAQEGSAGAENPRTRLRRAGEALAAGAAREPAVAKLFFSLRLGAVLDEKSLEAAREFSDWVAGVVAQGKADGSIRPGSAELWAAVWLAAVHLAVERTAAREWQPDDASVRLTLDAAWRAIAADPTPPEAAPAAG
ncbi:MAG TPA: TetR/AcrR family transcriptional regulator [Gemmatimonadales bacterium]|nr:TetR/AcrR family transcriptional regulator [Gemmatimonadales bacterium]